MARLPLTSDEIKNVVRLSPHRDSESPNPVDSPRGFCNACGNTSDRNRRGAARNALIPGFASTMTNIFLTVALRRAISWVSPAVPPKEENDPAEAVKNSREGRRRIFARSYLTRLDSGGMINSLPPENYHADKSNFARTPRGITASPGWEDV